jgi:glutamine amidotransferase
LSKIAIVDYGMGNLRSVQKAFESQGAKPLIVDSPEAIERADKVVLPGVGAFGAAMRELERRQLLGALRRKIRSGSPYLGLCLGLQILFEQSEESASTGGRPAKGLSLVEGCVSKFRGSLKVPHMGWNTLTIKKKNCPLLKGISSRDYFYFVHSYFAKPAEKEWILTETDYGRPFCSGIWKDNVFAFQFHPEKSQSAGLKLIKNFVKL